jgi:hypothetical protein
MEKIINYQCIADSNREKGYFLRVKNTSAILRVFRGGQDFFDPQIVLNAAKGNIRVKKVEAPLKPLEIAD